MAKYGKGKSYEDTCPNCGAAVEGLQSAGVHDMGNGCIKVYSEADQFVCPKCSQPSTGMCCHRSWLRLHLKETTSE